MNKTTQYSLTVRDGTSTFIHTTVVVTLRNGTQRTTTFNRIATDAEVLEDVIETALQAPDNAHVVSVHVFTGTAVEVWTWEQVRERVYTVPAFLTQWKTQPVHIGGVLTGYRPERRGPFGHHERKTSYVGNMYEPGSFEKAKELADAWTADLNKQEGT